MAKYLKAAAKCLERIARSKQAKLDSADRDGMIAELAAVGVKIPSARGDAFVAARYEAAFTQHKDTWSDAAREAALAARAASVKAKQENTVAAHGAASTAYNKAAKAATKAGAPGAAAEHKASGAEHLAAMRLVSNVNTQTAKLAHEASPIGKAEVNTREKSTAANTLTRAMHGAGTASDHDKAASAHNEAKKSWQEIEGHYRASGNTFKSTAAHTYGEQHAVKESEHRSAANQLRLSRK